MIRQGRTGVNLISNKSTVARTAVQDDNRIRERRVLLEQSQLEIHPHDAAVDGLTFSIDAGVFSPKYFGSTHVFTARMPWRHGERFLEMGCGAGITSVVAALRGAKSVLAVDISPGAVSNTRRNAALHCVDGALEARQSDVFDSIRPDETFDTIYWNLPFICVDDSYEYQSMLERALFDPGYRHTGRFLAGAREHLSKGGRLLVGFGDFGNRALLDDLCARFRWQSVEVARGSGIETGPVQFILLELTPA
jgi:release factor glutamine methyltransferase